MPISLILFAILISPIVAIVLIGLVPLAIMLGGGLLYDRVSLWWQLQKGKPLWTWRGNYLVGIFVVTLVCWCSFMVTLDRLDAWVLLCYGIVATGSAAVYVADVIHEIVRKR